MLLINFFRLVVPLPFRDLLIRLYFHLLDQRQLGTLRCFDIWCQIHYCSLFGNLSIRRRNFLLLGVGTYFCAGNQSVWLLLHFASLLGNFVPSENFSCFELSSSVNASSAAERERAVWSFGLLPHWLYFNAIVDRRAWVQLRWTVWKIFAFLRIEPKCIRPSFSLTSSCYGLEWATESEGP